MINKMIIIYEIKKLMKMKYLNNDYYFINYTFITKINLNILN